MFILLVDGLLAWPGLDYALAEKLFEVWCGGARETVAVFAAENPDKAVLFWSKS